MSSMASPTEKSRTRSKNTSRESPVQGRQGPQLAREMPSPGQAREAPVQPQLEPRFGHEFGQIRLHPVSRPSAVIQGKFHLNQIDDPYEREADQVAAKITQSPGPRAGMRGPAGKVRPSVQRRVAESNAGTAEAPAMVNDVLRSSGQPLDPPAREFFENRFGHDFGRVRVHHDGRAGESAQAMDALAYTVGQDMVFADGQYAPATPEGKQLLAHELTHVIQQGSVPGVPSAPTSLVQRSLGTYLKAMNQDPVDWYTAALHLNGESKTTIRQMLKNLGDPQRIAKLHRAALDGAGLGACSNVALLTEADYLRINPGDKPTDQSQCKAPSAPAAKPDAVPAAVQAGGAVDPLKRPAKEIMADEKYIDNHITRMEYYGAQEAYIFYEDGSKLELGLVPPYVKDPFDGVDYHTPRTTHISVDTNEPGVYKYIPRGTEVRPPAGTKYGEVLDTLTRSVTFKLESGSKRIVPTQVNTRTAPIVCQMLQESEVEFGKLMDETSKGGVKIFSAFKTVLEIYSFLPAGGLARGIGGKAATAAAGASEGVVAKLAKKLAEILAKGGTASELAAEGVSFGEVVVSRKGGALAVEYTFIENVGRVAGEGRAMQVALEQAAVQAAKEAGIKEAQVIVHTVVNQKWMAYLESIGYTKTIIDKAGQVGFESVWMKVLPVGG